MKLRTKFEDEDFKFGEVVEADIVSRFNKDELKIYCKAEAGGLHKIVYHYSTAATMLPIRLLDRWSLQETPVA